jgi:hypothetical protein
MKDCGECALCCKLLEVPGIAAAGQWCPHCAPGSKFGCCTIHDERPEFCQNWHCFWRAESWPDWLRPDRSKVIFEALPGVETILVSVEPSRPDAWKTLEIAKVIDILRKKGRPMVLKTKNDSVMVLAEGYSKADVLKDIETVLDWKEKMYGSSDVHD